MQNDLDPKGLKAAGEALRKMYRGSDPDEPFHLMAKTAIRAYLSAVPDGEGGNARLREQGVEVLRRLSSAKVSLSDASFIAGWVTEARAALAASRLSQAGVRVRPLEWHGNEGRGAGFKYVIAEPNRTLGWRVWVNLTDIGPNGMATSIGGHIVTMKAENREAAIAAAQADYEQRIKSALEEGEPEYVTVDHKGCIFHSKDMDGIARIAKANLEAAVAAAAPVPVPVTITPTHRHKKRGTEYVLIGIGKMQADQWAEHVDLDGKALGRWNSIDMREVAIYRSATDPTEIWVRPREEFEDGRFEVLSAKPSGEE